MRVGRAEPCLNPWWRRAFSMSWPYRSVDGVEIDPISGHAHVTESGRGSTDGGIAYTEIDGARCQCLQAPRYARWGAGTVPKPVVAARILYLFATPIGRCRPTFLENEAILVKTPFFKEIEPVTCRASFRHGSTPSTSVSRRLQKR